MPEIEWLIVVIGWTVIGVTLSITHLKFYRVGGGIYSMENRKIRAEKWVVRALSAIYMVAALFISLKVYWSAFNALEDVTRYYFVIVGVLLFLIAIVFFIAARIALGSNWTWSGELVGDRHKLIIKGPYARIRHPHYTSYLAAGFASGLILIDSRIIIFVILMVPFIYWKAIVEEQYLQMIFPEYKDYKKKTRMLF